jgi:single-stranded-DNA-specific exonuclease
VARQSLTEEDLLPLLEVDAPLEFSAIDMPLLTELNVLKPFGVGNPEPLFMTNRAEVCERRVFSAGIRYRLRQGGRAISGVIFGVTDDFPGTPGDTVDVAYRLAENEWNGTTTVELKIIDMRPSETVSGSGFRASS